MKVTSLRYLDAKFHHPSLGASPPNRGKSICLPPELSLLLKWRSVNKFRHRYSMLWPLIMYTIMWYWISFDSFCLLTEILKGIWVFFAIFRQRNVTKTIAIKPLVPSPVYSVYCRHRQSDCRSVINNEAGSRRTMLECCCRKLKKIPKNTNGRLAVPALAGLLVPVLAWHDPPHTREFRLVLHANLLNTHKFCSAKW